MEPGNFEENMSNLEGQLETIIQGIKSYTTMEQTDQVYRDIGVRLAQLDRQRPSPDEQEVFNIEHELYCGSKDELMHKVINKRSELFNMYLQFENNLVISVQRIWKTIDAWWLEWKKVNIGIQASSRLDLCTLDMLCSRINHVLLCTYDCVNRIKGFFTVQFGNQAENEVTKQKCIEKLQTIFKKHLQKMFIIDTNPPQILKRKEDKTCSFEMSCILLGGQALNLQKAPNVTAEVFYDTQVNEALIAMNSRGICTIHNSRNKPMVFNHQTKQWSTSFCKMQMLNINRNLMDTERLVTEEMYQIVLYTSVEIAYMKIDVATASLPIVIITHVSQKCPAKATLVWDAVFDSNNSERTSQSCPEEGKWVAISEAINGMFACQTGRPLTGDQLRYLGIIATKSESTGIVKQTITKATFAKNKLYPGGKFSFFEWVSACLALVNDSGLLQHEWQAGIIYGFISKDGLGELLSQCPPGTFALRFSESQLETGKRLKAVSGCLTLGVVIPNAIDNSTKIFHLKDQLTIDNYIRYKLLRLLDSFDFVHPLDKSDVKLLHFLYPRRSLNEVILTNTHLVQDKKQEEKAKFPCRPGQVRFRLNLYEVDYNSNGIDSNTGSVASVSSYNHGSCYNPGSVASVGSYNHGGSYNPGSVTSVGSYNLENELAEVFADILSQQ